MENSPTDYVFLDVAGEPAGSIFLEDDDRLANISLILDRVPSLDYR